jgi:hypothetical protein
MVRQPSLVDVAVVAFILSPGPVDYSRPACADLGGKAIFDRLRLPPLAGLLRTESDILFVVIPANAGIHLATSHRKGQRRSWIPAFAGMTR